MKNLPFLVGNLQEKGFCIRYLECHIKEPEILKHSLIKEVIQDGDYTISLVAWLIDSMNRDKQNKAIALKYEPKLDDAPRVIAKGKGKLAAKIIELARKHNIYIHDDPDLIEVLSRLDLNDEIPPDMYVVVAELLAFVYSLNGGKKIQ